MGKIEICELFYNLRSGVFKLYWWFRLPYTRIVFLLNGEILMIITLACIEKIKTQRIMVHGLRSKSEWL
jgi:hypothetical protein